MSAPKWSSYYLFLLASIGSTVGLSNIWKFTYLAGANGGGAFVLIYLLSLLVMGIPILAAELLIGRRGGRSMVGTLRELSANEGLHKNWFVFGWAANICVFLVLGFYCVIAGITLDYTVASIGGFLNGLNTETAVTYYESLLDNPLRLILSFTVFVALNIWIVARGVQDGLERSVGWMTPGLFVILVILVGYGAVIGDFEKGFEFLFAPDFSKVTPTVVLAAFGQSFFSLGIGVGVMLTYGAYMSAETRILRSAVIIAFSDGLASILAGLAIFPIVFGFGLSPGEGPGLIFMTLPIGFSQMPGGGFVGALFFLLLFFAALTSSISLLESVIAHLVEVTSWGRKRITIWAGVLLWVTGLASVLSFNVWKNVYPLGFITLFSHKTFYEVIDYFASNLLMPMGGILMAVMAGWLLKQEVVRNQLMPINEGVYKLWLWLVRLVAPFFVLMILLYNL